MHICLYYYQNVTGTGAVLHDAGASLNMRSTKPPMYKMVSTGSDNDQSTNVAVNICNSSATTGNDLPTTTNTQDQALSPPTYMIIFQQFLLCFKWLEVVQTTISVLHMLLSTFAAAIVRLTTIYSLQVTMEVIAPPPLI